MEDDILARLRNRPQVHPVQRGISNALIRWGGGTPQATQEDDLTTKIALLNYKNSLNQEEGYASEDEIPESMGGLPLKTVALGKGRRFKPTYGNQTPLFGGFDMQDMVNQFSQGQPAEPEQQNVQPSYDTENNDELNSILAEANYVNMSDEEQEQFIKFLESRMGGQNVTR